MRAEGRVVTGNAVCGISIVANREKLAGFGSIHWVEGSEIMRARPVLGGHAIMGSSAKIPLSPDAVPDRIVHNAYRLELFGERMRKRRR